MPRSTTARARQAGFASNIAMTLTWESSYAIARELRWRHPGIDMAQVGLQQIYTWTLELDDFDDEPALCNDQILSSILQEWYEELIDDR